MPAIANASVGRTGRPHASLRRRRRDRRKAKNTDRDENQVEARLGWPPRNWSPRTAASPATVRRPGRRISSSVSASVHGMKAYTLVSGHASQTTKNVPNANTTPLSSGPAEAHAQHPGEHERAEGGQEQLEDRRDGQRFPERQHVRGHAERREDRRLTVGEERTPGHDVRVPQRDRRQPRARVLQERLKHVGGVGELEFGPQPRRRRRAWSLPRHGAEQPNPSRTACARAAAPDRPSPPTARRRSPPPRGWGAPARTPRNGSAALPDRRSHPGGQPPSGRSARPGGYRPLTPVRFLSPSMESIFPGGARSRRATDADGRRPGTTRRRRPAAEDPCPGRSRLDPPPGRRHRRQRLFEPVRWADWGHHVTLVVGEYPGCGQSSK